MAEKVLVIGAGIAGLWTALALAPTGREVILLDRDPPPPEGGPEEAFAHWTRRGVGQMRQSHAFLARLRVLLRQHHPRLLQDLLEAGCRELSMASGLTAEQRRSYRPQAGDEDLAVLTSRRTTLELVIRRYVERLPGVTIRPSTFVRELILDAGPTVRGVRLEGGSELLADLVVDAAGLGSTAFEQLTAAGAGVTETSEGCGVIYFTRHFRLRPGLEEPPRTRLRTTGDMGYLKFGVFPGDNGCFSITLCTPEVEEELRKAVFDPAAFDAVCAIIPGLAPWTDPARSEGVGRVHGMGRLESRWRDLAPNGRAGVRGFFSIGDSLVRTNPLYGRGCSFSAVCAYLLRDALDDAPDPAARLVCYRDAVERELRPYYQVMLQADRSAIRRARAALTPGHRPSLQGRIVRSFLENGVNLAIRDDPDLLREFLRGFHMLEHPQAWLRRPRNLAKVLARWAQGRKDKAGREPVRLGPSRDETMQALGLSSTADWERLKAAA
jgi:2-polyprenyl-6-methoxyphenol hydroxylase-like FAD-dependent oxidoreductase